MIQTGIFRNKREEVAAVLRKVYNEEFYACTAHKSLG